MSVILDALRKLDHEKSSRGNGTANIAVEILRPDLPRPGKRILLYISAIFVTAITTAAITYYVMAEFAFVSKSAPPPLAGPSVPIQPVSPTPLEFDSLSKPSPPAAVNPPTSRQKLSSAPPSREPVRDARGKITRVPPKIESHIENTKPASEKETSQSVISEEANVAPENMKKPAEQTESGSIATLPSLRVSGIIWSEDPSKRFAVINGMPFTEGSVIEGVKVVEIFPTYVCFLHNEWTFEITLGSSTAVRY